MLSEHLSFFLSFSLSKFIRLKNIKILLNRQDPERTSISGSKCVLTFWTCWKYSTTLTLRKTLFPHYVLCIPTNSNKDLASMMYFIFTYMLSWWLNLNWQEFEILFGDQWRFLISASKTKKKEYHTGCPNFGFFLSFQLRSCYIISTSTLHPIA